MSPEFEPEGNLTNEGANSALLSDIDRFLGEMRALDEMRQMDEEIAGVITPEDYLRYNRYRQFSLNELSAFNQTPGLNGALRAALERGFILGYWFARQHTKETDN